MLLGSLTDYSQLQTRAVTKTLGDSKRGRMVLLASDEPHSAPTYSVSGKQQKYEELVLRRKVTFTL